MSTTYIITFEVNDNERRETLYAKIKEVASGQCKIHANAWAIKSDKKAAEIRDLLTPVLNSSDRIFIIRSGTMAAWKNVYGPKFSEWLKNNL